MKLVKKPWGKFEQFTHNEVSTVKILTVNSNGILSLQKHRHRKEMWYFLTEGYAQIGNNKKKYNVGSIVTIGKNTLHRLYAKNKPVKVLEISFGKFDENDIIRVEDIYNRI